MDLLFNQEQQFYNSTLADLETSYHLLKIKRSTFGYKKKKKTIYRAQH
jgi:hypothetical protein